MTFDGAEKFRPKFHFSPRVGWVNDPNGLIRVDGVWHLFYQYDPDSTLHGPMHWGHAKSIDLVNWEELPVALFPDVLGTCYSGSAAQTAEGDVKLFYTAHRKLPEVGDYQVQSLVHADSLLTEFSKDNSNPVIDNPGLSVFRDPKVIWHKGTSRWIMVLTHGQSIGIHSSADLVTWQLESTFGDGQGRHGPGPWECPDLIEMVAPDGTCRWALIVGIGSGAYASGSGTQYFIGTFDGRAFKNDNPPSTVLWLDYGRDYYAAQTFFDLAAEMPIAIAWASNWVYARQTPTSAFRGVMSLPRQLQLAETATGLRLAAKVPQQVAKVFDHYELGAGPIVPGSATYRVVGALRVGPDQSIALCLFGEASPQIVLERRGDGAMRLRLCRDNSQGMTDFGHDYCVPLECREEVDVEIFVDSGLVEISMEHGTTWATNLYFPKQPAGTVTVKPA